MKIIKLFLLLSLILWADTLPKTPQCIEYKTIKNVITKGWEYSDENLSKWVSKDGENFLLDFQKVIKKPLILLTDEEYLKKQMESYETTKKILQDTGYSIRSKANYKKRQIHLIKHGIYYGNYTNRVDSETYRYALIMIKYLENQQRYLESSKLYISLLERLINDIAIHDKSFIETAVWGHKEEELFLSLRSSLKNDKYTKEQRKEFSKYLSKLLPINQSMFIDIMQNERKFVLSYMYMEFIENQSFQDFVKYDNKSIQEAVKYVNNEMMKRYFEDKALMQKLLDTYKKKHDLIFNKLLNMESKKALDSYIKNMPSFSDLLSYSAMARLFVMKALDKIGLPSFAKVFQYEFNEDEFVEVVSQFFITSGKPWVLGKYKFEWAEKVKQNEELLKQ